MAQACRRMFEGPLNDRPVHVLFCLVDHFEPRWGNVSAAREKERVDTWIRKYSTAVKNHQDADGCPPRYTFFYPIDEYTPEAFERIVEFCKKGLGEIEVQLHHDNDTSESLRQKLEQAKRTFSQWGVLCEDKYTKEIKYGFIHGNWALDNSRPDGKWCGVNNELQILKDTGCYADFTLPSAPSDTQTLKINSLYYAQDNPQKPKSHNRGVDVEAGQKPSGDLMIIQGPLSWNWQKRKMGIFPRIENSEISLDNPPTQDRIDLWVNQRIAVKGKADHLFIKVHTHGLKDEHLKDEFFENLDFMFGYLEDKYNDGGHYKLHYVTAREMYNIIKAVEAGEPAEPQDCRDYLLESNMKRGRWKMEGGKSIFNLLSSIFDFLIKNEKRAHN